MKKIINPKTIPFIVILGSIIGMLLRIWTQGGGPDVFGLYPRMPLAWVVLGLFSAALVAAVIVAVRPLNVSGSYGENYPKSVLGFIGYLLAGGGVLFSAYEQFIGSTAGVMDTVTAYVGFAAGAVLLVLSVFRLQGKKSPFLLHGFVCLYLALRLFNRCQSWSNESQMGVVLVPFLASLALMLAFYHRTTFDVDMGKRPKCLTWALVTTYLCVMAVLSFEDIIFYATWALWMMTNLCSLKPLKETEAEELADLSPEELENWLGDEQE